MTILLFTLISSCQTKNNFSEVPYLNPKVKDVLNKIDSIISYYETVDTSKYIFVVSCIKDDKHFISIGVSQKESLKFVVDDTSKSIHVFFEYKGNDVIVFKYEANGLSKLFDVYPDKKHISYFRRLEIKNRGGRIPPPPVVIEPLTWLYIFDGNNLALFSIGQFGL